MGAVAARIVRKFVEVSQGPVAQDALLESVGLSRRGDSATDARTLVAADTYYDVLERCSEQGDHALPLRYGAAMEPEDFGAFGLALKTARTVGDALERLVRYILVVTDTLAYELVEEPDGRRLVLRGRSSAERRGIQVANEGALAAIVSILRQVAAAPVVPTAVSFRHRRATEHPPHRDYFGCDVNFGASVDALHFHRNTLAVETRLGDEGLSAFLLSQLEDQRSKHSEGALVFRVRRAVTDALCDGPPRRAHIARQLGLSERTLQRHLSEHGLSFQTVVSDVRREVAETLLTTTNESIAEVAFLTGFSDQSAFGRAFKGWTGRTPLGFREAAPRS